MLKEQLTDLVEDRDGRELGRQKGSRQENGEESKQGCEVQSLNKEWDWKVGILWLTGKRIHK